MILLDFHFLPLVFSLAFTVHIWKKNHIINEIGNIYLITQWTYWVRLKCEGKVKRIAILVIPEIHINLLHCDKSFLFNVANQKK